MKGVYKYKALHENLVKSGTICASNMSSVMFLLRQIDMIPIHVSKKYFVNDRFSDDKMCIWIENLMILLSSGLNINEAINIMSDDFSINKQILYFLDKGECLSNVMMYYSHIFPSSFIKIFKVMIKFHSINEILRFFLNFHKNTQEIMKNNIKKLYSSFISLLIALGLLIFMLMFGIDAFILVLTEFETKIPPFVNFVYIYKNIILLTICFTLILLYKFIHKIPIINQIHQEYYCFLFFNFIYEAMKNGIHVDDAVRISSEILPKNSINVQMFENLIINGHAFYECCHLINIPEKQVSILRISEKGGDLLCGLKISSSISESNMKIKISKLYAIMKLSNIAISLFIVLYIFKLSLVSISSISLDFNCI